MKHDLPLISEARRLRSPLAMPQALAYHGGTMWISSRDKPQLYTLDADAWVVRDEANTPGTVWAAVWGEDALLLTVGEGPNDDRYLRRYRPETGFDVEYRVSCPEFTGSYLSYGGEKLYLSQWYKHRILQLDARGGIVASVQIEAEISGHVFANGALYILCGTEADGEDWCIARVVQKGTSYLIEPLARVPFPCRSLTFDGDAFWTNHRIAGETVRFSLPKAC